MLIEIFIGLWMALLSGYVYARFGGDGTIGDKWKWLKPILKVVHHWHIGIVLAVLSIIMIEHYLVFKPLNWWLVGFGNGLVLEDYFYHQSHDW